MDQQHTVFTMFPGGTGCSLGTLSGVNYHTLAYAATWRSILSSSPSFGDKDKVQLEISRETQSRPAFTLAEWVSLSTSRASYVTKKNMCTMFVSAIAHVQTCPSSSA